MAKRILQKMQEKIRKRLYVMTLHAEEEMDSDGLTIFDVESVILTGEIIEPQRDRKTGERKYLVRGETLERGQAAVVVSKFGATDKLVILTVYVE
ncbi:MAG: DUF4258 domain-containing protein [Thermoanaerobaculia bacterium]